MTNWRDFFSDLLLPKRADSRSRNSDSSGSTALVYRIDYGRMMAQMGSIFAGMGLPQADLLAGMDQSLPVTIWMGISGSTWSSGIGLDLQSLIEFASSLKDSAEDSAEEPFPFEVK